MTNTNTNTNSNDFNFTSKEAAIALLLDARKGLASMQEEIAQHEAYMSDLCKSMLETFGAEDAETGKKSLQLDLGDGSQRGHIVVQRGDLYFVRERNSGRPVGSKNRKASSEVPAVAAPEAQPEVVVEEPSVVTSEASAATIPAEGRKDETVAEVLASLDADVASEKASTDPTVDAILSVASQAINALKEHSRSVAPSVSAAE